MQQGNTKERIVEAYIELESERPLEKITVTALVERSRITRKTFYYYFKDIYDLMEYRMERASEPASSSLQRWLPTGRLLWIFRFMMRKQLDLPKLFL